MDKWEAVKEVLTSPNAWMFLLFVIFVLFVLNRMAKSGLLSFKGKGLRVGSDETERTIIREQSKWAYLFIMAIKGKVLTEDATEARTMKILSGDLLAGTFSIESIPSKFTYTRISDTKFELSAVIDGNPYTRDTTREDVVIWG